VADEELAPDRGEAAELAPDAQQEPQDDTPEPIAKLATDLGWTPRDQWHGEPEKWKPAEQFIRDGRDIQQTTARELRSVREQMERMGNVVETVAQDRVAAARAQWETEMARAVEDGDTAAAMKLARQEPQAKQSNGPDPQVAAWVAKNPWFNTDPLARVKAEELSARLAHLPVADQLAQVERAMKKDFPEHFPAPAKAPPATQTGAARSTGASNRVKGFADMPAASQKMAREMVERHPSLTLDAIAKSFWTDQERVSR
jgi:hypothetical protein